jgi:hypothetical protein
VKSARHDRWVTIIAISCENKALLPYWKTIEHQLRHIVYKVGWDGADYRRKLEQISAALAQVDSVTIDKNLPLGEQLKPPPSASLSPTSPRPRARAKAAGVPPPAQSRTPQSRDA